MNSIHYRANKKRVLLFGGALIIALVYILHLAREVRTVKQYHLGYVTIPENSILEKNSYEDYSIVGTDLVHIGVPWPQDFVIKQIDSISYMFSDIPSWGLVLSDTERVLISMGVAHQDMLYKIGQHTDDICSHDCLYHPILYPFYKSSTQRGFSEGGILQRLTSAIKSLDYNLTERIKMSISHPVGDMSFIYSGKELIRLKLLYRAASGKLYAFSYLNYEEKDWDLYYYPTVYLGDFCFENSSAIAADNNGYGLFSMDDNKEVYEYYCRLDNGFYCRVWSNAPINNTELVAHNVRVSYLNDTDCFNSFLNTHVFNNVEM
ncbi:MAG: hypothetical protein IJK44_08420 [Bacteroidales bacterium]|nr:hypothetical protein [Bacteroidales bacterium]